MARSRQDFRALFADEARGRLARLGQLLLELEGNSEDPQLVVAIFREVHTLKGAAAVVGFEDVSQAAHGLEEILEDLRAGRCTVDAAMVDLLLSAVDTLSSLTESSLAGRDQSAEATAFAASLQQRRPAPVAAAPGAPPSHMARVEPSPSPLRGHWGGGQEAEVPTTQPAATAEPASTQPATAAQPVATARAATTDQPAVATKPPPTPQSAPTPHSAPTPQPLTTAQPPASGAPTSAAPAPPAGTGTGAKAAPAQRRGGAEPSDAGMAPDSPAVSSTSTLAVPASFNTPLVASPPMVATPSVLTTPSTDRHSAIMVPLERLDDLIRLVSESASAHLRVGRVLKEWLGQQPADVPEFNELSRLLNELQEQTMRARMVPLSTITDQLQRAARDVARTLGKELRFEVLGEDTELDRGVLHQLADSLLHLVRNAVDHGVEGPEEREEVGKDRRALVRLHAMQLGSEIIIAISDDGRGIDLEAIRRQVGRRSSDGGDITDEEALQLIFRPGLSTARFITDVSGRGVGLDVVRTSVEAARGRVDVRTERGRGTEFRVVVPVTLAVQRCLVVAVGPQLFALPLHRVVQVHAAEKEAEDRAEGRLVLRFDGLPVPLSDLASALDIVTEPVADSPIVVLTDIDHRHAFRVDRLIGQRDVVIKGLSGLVPRLSVVAGASVDVDGTVLVVLDPPGLLERAKRVDRRTMPHLASRPETTAERRVLVVDDALTVRELQRSILQRAGFDVRVAGDGVEALSLLAAHPIDLVLTDIDMPRMDGFELTESIRGMSGLANLPVVILSSRASDDDKRRGMEVGADAYIVKSAFDEHALLSVVHRLIGEAA